MSAASRMTMRMATSRRAAGTDTWTQNNGSYAAVLTEAACWAWVASSGKRGKGPEDAAATTYQPWAMVAIGTDVLVNDKITSIVDRNAGSKFGELWIDGIVLRQDHLELRLREHE